MIRYTELPVNVLYSDHNVYDILQLTLIIAFHNILVEQVYG